MRITTITWAACLAIISCSTIGCKNEGQQAAAGSGAEAEEEDSRSPEQRFESILERFRQSIETNEPGVVSGFTISEKDGGRSRLTFQTDVSHKLFPPKNPDEIYRAEITVTTRSRYSMILPQDTPAKEEKDTKTPDDEQGDSDLINDNWDDDLSGRLLESQQSSANEKSARARSPLTDEILATPPTEDVQTFELAYKGDRWVLSTKPQLESINEALEHALTQQY
jgi:hypothetical protein